MFPLLIVLCGIVLWAGITLEDAGDLLDRYGLLAVMVPAMIGMGGNLGSILSARLSTRLHLGTTTFDPTDRLLWANVAAIFALATTIFTALAGAVWLFGIVVGATLTLGHLLVISLVSGLSIAAIAVVASVVATYGSYRLGIDPDDTTIPIVTNVVDVFGMLVFLAVSRWVLVG
ncbi:magnesium transporter [Halonotius roseus]|uniref:ABC transporter permease n=1 Tax=Halonotius roseus TaxID=2511997 RepID=A0A544QSV3_9EURY|nr:ABC transporter permease [Halonotius roseus]